MKQCVWYISKYAAPANAITGWRGYMIMREIAKIGHRCLIITSDFNRTAATHDSRPRYDLENVDGLQIFWIRTLKHSVGKSFKRILSWIDFEWRLLIAPKDLLPQPDVIVVSSLSLLTILNGFVLRKKFACRLIFEIRDIWPLTIVEEGGFSRYNPFVVGLAYIERAGYKYSDAIVGTMPNLGEHVCNVLGYKKEAFCIPMGINESTFYDIMEVPADYLTTYIPVKKFVVVYAGAIGISNAIDTLLKCAESLGRNKNIHFLIVGDGDFKKKYEAEYGALCNITFAPKVPKQMVLSVLSKCDLLYFSVHASEVWRYGQSLNKVVDYMLTGKPIVASYSGFPSMIDEAECGTYVAAGEVAALRAEIVRYSEMPEAERDKIGRRGKRWILKHRTYASLAEDYLSIMFP